jgi:hypothetical protein
METTIVSEPVNEAVIELINSSNASIIRFYHKHTAMHPLIFLISIIFQLIYGICK